MPCATASTPARPTESVALIDVQGETFSLDGFAVAAIGLKDGVAFATGGGSVWFGRRQSKDGHDGAVLSACGSPDGLGVVTGGDDGTVRQWAAGGGSTVLHGTSRWIDVLAVAQSSGLIAAGSSKHIEIIDKTSKHSFSLASSVSGLAFDPKGKRLAASGYQGVSLWWAASPQTKPDLLPWAGSHIGVTWSPCGRFVVSAMQDAALHGWRLADKADMRMTGYPAKTRAMAWTPKGRWLATSGAASVVCWPFRSKDGPMGQAPLEMPAIGPLVTQVAAHPQFDIIAAGYQDGSVVLFRLDDSALVAVAGPGDAPVSALAFSRDGRLLGFGCEDGRAGLVRTAG